MNACTIACFLVEFSQRLNSVGTPVSEMNGWLQVYDVKPYGSSENPRVCTNGIASSAPIAETTKDGAGTGT